VIWGRSVVPTGFPSSHPPQPPLKTADETEWHPTALDAGFLAASTP
jgi:hypothetical protein